MAKLITELLVREENAKLLNENVQQAFDINQRIQGYGYISSGDSLDMLCYGVFLMCYEFKQK